MNQTNNKIREEWKNAIVDRVTFEEYLCCGGDYCDGDCGEQKMKDVADWWLSKIDELLKSQEHKLREELVEKIKEEIKKEYSKDEYCYQTCIVDILQLLSNLSTNKENKNNERNV
jgi:hypothetical protein